MDCVEIADRLLVPEEDASDPELDAHVSGCACCAQLARSLRRLDVVLSSVIVAPPPAELQQRLAQLALDAGSYRAQPWWQGMPQIVRSLTERPQLVAAQGLAAVMLALAGWQVFGWLSAFQPVVGNVGYAIELVASSPAAGYVSNVQIDFQSLGLWSMVGIIGWLVSENGLIGRRIASSGLQLP